MKNSSIQHQIVRFDEICRNVSKRVNDPRNSGYEKFVGLEHIDTLEPKIMRYGSTKDVNSSMTLFKKGQILFGRRNWHLRRVAVADFDGICSADIYTLEPKEGKILKDFLPIFMHTDQFFEKCMMYSVGSMSTRVKWSNIREIEFLIPTLDEQRSVIQLIQKIDDTIYKAQNLIATTILFQDSKVDRLLSKGLKDEKQKNIFYSKKSKIKIGQIPNSWEIYTVSDLVEKDYIFEFQDGNHGDLHPKGNDFTNSGKPFLTATQIDNDGNLNFENCKKLPESYCKKLRIGFAKPNDVLLTHNATVGRVAIIPSDQSDCIIGTSITYYRLNEEVLDRNYFSYVLRSQFIKKQMEREMYQSTREQFSILKQAKLKIPIPSLQIQKEITAQLQIINSHKLELQKYIRRLKSMRKNTIKIKLNKFKILEEEKIVQ